MVDTTCGTGMGAGGGWRAVGGVRWCEQPGSQRPDPHTPAHTPACPRAIIIITARAPLGSTHPRHVVHRFHHVNLARGGPAAPAPAPAAGLMAKGVLGQQEEGGPAGGRGQGGVRRLGCCCAGGRGARRAPVPRQGMPDITWQRPKAPLCTSPGGSHHKPRPRGSSMRASIRIVRCRAVGETANLPRVRMRALV